MGDRGGVLPLEETPHPISKISFKVTSSHRGVHIHHEEGGDAEDEAEEELVEMEGCGKDDWVGGGGEGQDLLLFHNSAENCKRTITKEEEEGRPS